MPPNKKPRIRYLAYDRCLMNSAKKWGYQELLDYVNKDLTYRKMEPIGRTTFYSDIRDMEVEFNAPIEKYREGGRVFYRYTDPDYSFANQPLNEEEIEHIKDAVLILSRFSGLPGFEWMDDVISKLELGTFEEVGDPNIISFESSEFLKGKEFIGPIFHAITEKQVLKILYQKFDDTTVKEHLIHPYHLKEYDSRWYVLGYLPKHDTLITLSVDRIVEIIIQINAGFIENTRFDFMAHFEDLIGVRKDNEAEPIKIKLKFSPLMADYVKTKPLHGSQKKISIDEDGSLIVSIEVIPNFELENLLFSYKDEVEVLEPITLRNRMQEIIESMSRKYS